MEQEINGKVQKINEEDYEIIKKLEDVGLYNVIKWYQENYDCEPNEAIESIIAIKQKYNVKYQGDDKDEILQRLYSGENPLQVVKWYKEKYDLSLKDAKDKVDEVLNEFHVECKGGASSKGCMITILIAITSTLSFLCLL